MDVRYIPGLHVHEHGRNNHHESVSFSVEAEAFAKPFGLRFDLGVLVEEYKSC